MLMSEGVMSQVAVIPLAGEPDDGLQMASAPASMPSMTKGRATKRAARLT